MKRQTPEVALNGRLLLKPFEAAAILGISPRQLWAHTSPRGSIPCTRIGKCARYSRAALEEFISSAGGDK